MALTMLDYLFDRETQAASNLSGMGKYGKKQLDPLMIYGIRCKYTGKEWLDPPIRVWKQLGEKQKSLLGRTLTFQD